MRHLIFGAVLLLAGSAVLARWGPLGCAQPSQVAPPASVDAYEWKVERDDPDRACLYRGGVHIGSWDYPQSYYRSYDSRTATWGPHEAKAPIEPPARAVAPRRITPPLLMPSPPPAETPVQNHGVEWDRIGSEHGGRITLGGREITRTEALAAITNKIPDDAKKLRVTVIGNDGQRKPVADQLRRQADVLDRCIVWDLPPDSFHLKDLAKGTTVYRVDGTPTVYCQAPDGRVLHRQDDGAQVVEAIRKAVKAYDASKDPDLRKPPAPTPTPKKPDEPAPTPAPGQPLPWLLIAGAAFVLFYSLKGKV